MWTAFTERNLDLSYNWLVNLDLNIFKGFEDLAELNLNGNRLQDIKVEDIKNTTRIRVSIIESTRLKVIIDILSRRDRIILLKPCDQLTCKVNISGIACNEYKADLTSEAS